MTHIEQRYDTAAEWALENPVLHEGEVGWEGNTRRSKLGDGFTPWNDLLYTVSDVAVNKEDIGLGEVDNTSDEDKPVSTATQAALDLKAPKNSPVFTGNPTAPTPTSGDGDTSIATTEFVKAAVAAAMLAMNPVGSLKFSETNVNPGTYMGGTWAAWGSGRVPVGVDPAQSEFDTAGETGGAKTHTLTSTEMPTHSHTGTTGSAGVHTHPTRSSGDAGGSTLAFMRSGNSGVVIGGGMVDDEGAHTHGFTTATTGGGGAHNNLQPYITCYMWKRTA